MPESLVDIIMDAAIEGELRHRVSKAVGFIVDGSGLTPETLAGKTGIPLADAEAICGASSERYPIRSLVKAMELFGIHVLIAME